jgi:MYXO-CTERM domain-containing protein
MRRAPFRAFTCVGCTAAVVAVVLAARVARAADTYVATSGSDTTGDGSMGKPWATIAHAVNTGISAGGGDTVIVEDGTYSGVNTITRGFPSPVTVRAEHDHQATLTNVMGGQEVIRVWVDGVANITIAGFVMTNHDPNYTCPNGRETYFLVHFQDASNVTLTNNILFGNNAPGTCNEILKLNRADPNAFTHDILVQGNVFYEHAPAPGADFIDSDGSSSIEIVDNVFFDDAMEMLSQSFWTLKGQPANAPAMPFPRHKLHRNVFLSWAGLPDQAFIQLGEDGLPRWEFTDALIENNLMIGDSPLHMSAPMQFKGAEGITVRANTLVGPFTASAFGFRIGTEGQNPQVKNFTVTNDLFDDPTGAMQQVFTIYGDVLLSSVALQHDLFWNAGQPLPTTGAVTPAMDAQKVVGDPQLQPSHAGIVLPRWDATKSAFLSGSTTIPDEFARLVQAYGGLTKTSAAVDAADPAQMPAEDILGHARDAKPDIGAYEYGATMPAPDGGGGDDAGSGGDGGSAADSGTAGDAGDDASTRNGATGGSSGGCGCAADPGSGAEALPVLGVLVISIVRRLRKRK